MTEKCECLKQIKERWPEPFERPITVNREKNFNLETGNWAVKVFEMNPSGKTIKQGSIQHLMLNYCPICGCKLIDDPEEPNDNQD